MPWHRRTRQRIECPGVGRPLTEDDRSGGRPDLFICPGCYAWTHRRADGTVPFHWREVVQF